MSSTFENLVTEFDEICRDKTSGFKFGYTSRSNQFRFRFVLLL